MENNIKVGISEIDELYQTVTNFRVIRGITKKSRYMFLKWSSA